MPLVEKRSVLTGISVGHAMQRQLVRLDLTATVGQGIRMMIRYKTNAVLLTANGSPCGVVSKTDLMGAFYAGLSTETVLGEVMGGQPIACFPDDPVEDALEIMEAAGVQQLYVTGADREAVIGTLGYTEIVGLLYRYCRACERGTAKKREARSGNDPSIRLIVKDVMSRDVRVCLDGDPLFTVIETLSDHHMGAVLIIDGDRRPIGVVSKTDLVIAYHHGVFPETQAREIMNTPVHCVSADAFLPAAIQQMLIGDVQRLFVHGPQSSSDPIAGVLTLHDAARFRSGSCRACTAGRMLAG